jgi:hypothetical protein
MEYILDNLKKEKDMARGNLFGLMVNNLMAIGKKERKMGLEFGNRQKVIIMKGNGNKIGRVEEDITFMLEDQNIEEISKNFSNMEKVSRNFPMEIVTLENILAENHMVMENMFGRMEIFMRDNFLKDQDKEEDY